MSSKSQEQLMKIIDRLASDAIMACRLSKIELAALPDETAADQREKELRAAAEALHTFGKQIERHIQPIRLILTIQSSR